VEFRRWRSGCRLVAAHPTTAGQFHGDGAVTDSKAISAAATLPVSIGSVTGRWNVTFQGIAIKPENIDLVQNKAT